jgi:hypothetical protein
MVYVDYIVNFVVKAELFGDAVLTYFAGKIPTGKDPPKFIVE